MKQGKFNVMQSADSNEHIGIWYVSDVKTNEINEAVYAVFCHVAQMVLDRSVCHISGDRTASEIAGYVDSRWHKCVGMLENNGTMPMAPSVRIIVGEYLYTKRSKPVFSCIFATEAVFEQMAEWEGSMSLAATKQHRFGCEAKGQPYDGKLVKYTRCHQPKPTNPYSAAYEEKRINKKLEIIGELRRRLSGEGMKRALAVLCAAKQWENCQSKYRMALEVMRRRLWKDYGTDKYAGPMPYCAKDFEYGPEIWKQVDVDYANMLRKLFCDMLNAAPAPKWISKRDYVQVKDKEKLVENLQGKLYVTNVYAKLDDTGEKLMWMANVVASKGREWQFEVDRLEPWKEPEKTKKSGKKKTASKNTAKTAPSHEVSAASHEVAEPSIEDRLRAALRKQLAAA